MQGFLDPKMAAERCGMIFVQQCRDEWIPKINSDCTFEKYEVVGKLKAWVIIRPRLDGLVLFLKL